MRFIETRLNGAFILELEERPDDRGFFARSFCAEEFRAQGLNPTIAQCNLAGTRRKGTLRGLHYQTAPATETKLMRCLRGAIYDIIVDLRPESPTYLAHIGVELSAENHRSLYVPGLFAHGYQTLTDDAEILCAVGAPYHPACERGLRYDDPALAIDLPLAVSDISEKDQAWALLEHPLEVAK